MILSLYRFIGSRNTSLLGSVTSANVWFRTLNRAEVRTLSRGAYNVLSYTSWPNWEKFSSTENTIGNIERFSRSNVYLPSESVLDMHDCKSVSSL